MINQIEKYIIQLSDVDIYQDNNPVLTKVNFNISKGEFVFIIGKTGSGKSSLLKTLYCDIPLKKGKALISQFDLSKMSKDNVPFLRRHLGIIFQDFQLLTDRTVEDNLLFVLQATGWSDIKNIKKRIIDVLLMVGLSNHQKKMPHQLSGGEQQRLVIARALLNEPLVLIADEPTGNLDPEIANEILNLFYKINNSGTAVIMATHNHEFIKTKKCRVLECREGHVIDHKI